MGAGMAVGGWFCDQATKRLGPRLGRAIVPAGGLFVCAVFVVVAAFAHDDTTVLVSLVVASGAYGAGEAAFWTASVSVGGARGGTAAAILNTGGNAVGMIAPIATPMLVEAFNWTVALLVASAISLLSAAMWLGVHIEVPSSKPISEEAIPDEDHAY